MHRMHVLIMHMHTHAPMTWCLEIFITMKKSSLIILFCFFTAMLATGTCLLCEHCKSASDLCSGPLQNCTGVEEDACLTLTIETRADKVRKVVTYKGCTKLSYCPPGPWTITMDLKKRIRSNSECCCWDRCNKGGLRLPVLGKQNRLWCPRFKSSTCSIDDKLYCHGREINCFYLAGYTESGGKNETYVRRGCGTKHTCIDKPGIFGIPGLFLEKVTKTECSKAT